VLAITLAACSSGPNKPKDAAIDGAELFFTGEVVDWDSTDTMFCGVFMAGMEVDGDATRHDSTNPNGRFQLNLAPAATTRVDITPPTAASECVTGNPTYAPIPGIVIADQAVIAASGFYSVRAMTSPRLTTFFTQVGTPFDSSKAQVFVHVDGTARPVSIDAAHDATQAWDGTTWAAGDTGVNVFFPNVAVGAGTTTISMTGATGAGPAPIIAGTITYVTLIGG
jgi:hypothetical protein